MAERKSIQVTEPTHKALKSLRKIKQDGEQEDFDDVIVRLLNIKGVDR